MRKGIWIQIGPPSMRALRVLRPWLGTQSRRVTRARWSRRRIPEVDVASPRNGDSLLGGAVDVVITWVDDADPQWDHDRIRRLQDTRNLSPDALAGARFRTHDELRYLIRSLEECLPWVRDIIVVTAGQRPGWIEEGPGPKFVYHKEFFASPEDLPTFNSHAIESQLWRIDGLAERWIYFNDDVIPLRPLGPERFFDSFGRPVVQFGSGVRDTDRRSTDLALAGVDRLIENRFGLRADRKIAHVPHAQSQSVWRALDQEVGSDLALVAARPFRSIDDIAPIALHHWWAFATGQAVQGDFRPQYVEVTEFGAQRTIVNAIRDPEVDVVCVNQAGHATSPVGDKRARHAIAALNRRFPSPSRFESETHR
jgi:Stealth protein CR2, conserved region 2/Stealth protein CR3, conserved region 3